MSNQITTNSIQRSVHLPIFVILVSLSLMSCFNTREVTKAFKNNEMALVKSNQNLAISNDSLKRRLINKGGHIEIIEEIENISSIFNKLIDSTMNVLIIQSGGWKENSNQRELAKPRNMEIPTQILVKDGLGDKIEELISQTSKKYNQIIKEQFDTDTIQIPLKLHLAKSKESGKTWAEYNFNQLPLYAVLPFFRSYKLKGYETMRIIYRLLAKS